MDEQKHTRENERLFRKERYIYKFLYIYIWFVLLSLWEIWDIFFTWKEEKQTKEKRVYKFESSNAK